MYYQRVGSWFVALTAAIALSAMPVAGLAEESGANVISSAEPASSLAETSPDVNPEGDEQSFAETVEGPTEVTTDPESTQSKSDDTQDITSEQSDDLALQADEDEPSTDEQTDAELERHPRTVDDGTYVVRSSLANRLVIDKAGGLKANAASANAQLYTCNMTAAQKPAITYDEATGLYTITLGDGTALEVAGGQAFKGANVRWWRDNGTKAQKWVLIKNDDGSITFASALDTNLVIDIPGGKAQNAANLRLWSSNGSQAQRFFAISLHADVAPSNCDLDGKIYTIASAQDNKLVLDVAGASTKSGADVRLYTSNGTQAQAWRFEKTETGYYRIRPTHSHAALDVSGGGILPTTRVQQWVYGSSDNLSQQWSVQHNDDGTYSFYAVSSGLALSVDGETPRKFAGAQINLANGGTAQRWKLRMVGGIDEKHATDLKPGTYRIELASSRASEPLTMDIAGGSTANRANVRLYGANSTIAQQYEVVVHDDRSVSLISPRTKKAVDVAGGSVWPSANVQMFADNGTPAQRWMVYANSDGTYSFRSMASGLALDAAGTSSGSNLRTNLIASNARQKFRLTEVVSNLALANMFDAGEVSSIRVIGDSVSWGARLRNCDTVPRGPGIAMQVGKHVTRESSLLLPTYVNLFRSYATDRGVTSFVNAGISRKEMADLALHPNEWIMEGADVIVVALGINDAINYPASTFKANATKALSEARKHCKLLIVVTEPIIRTDWKMSGTQVDNILREVCAKNGYLHIKLLNCVPDSATYWNADRIHPIEAGQALIWKNFKAQLCL